MDKKRELKGENIEGFGMFEKTIFVLLILLLAAVIYFMFYYVGKCESFECFKDSMEKCKKIKYVNEEPEASWSYFVKGKAGDLCETEVKLLLAKEGELGIDELVGYEMSCYYQLGTGTYPEKDLSVCHGRLKEELQQIIIDKLHAYIIENLGKIGEGINE